MNERRKLLQKRLEAVRKERGVGEIVVNRDWVQAQVLGAIARNEQLRNTLVFKGGTALQKVFFGPSFRFSEDLDFTATNAAPKDDDLKAALDAACADAQQHIRATLNDDERVVLTCERYEERERHRTQEAFIVRFQMPWQSRPLGQVMLEVTFDEPIVIDAAARPLLVTYDDVDAKVFSYAVEEIVIEKLRAAPQTLANREKRKAAGRGAWVKPRSRDFYDLWHIAKNRTDVDWTRVAAKLSEKCAVRDVRITSIDDVFVDEIVAGVKEKWRAQLAHFVPAPLPDVDALLVELHSLLRDRLVWE